MSTAHRMAQTIETEAELVLTLTNLSDAVHHLLRAHGRALEKAS